MEKVQKIKYRINWPVVFRNLIIVSSITICILSNKQIKDNEIKMQQLDEQIRISQIATKHSIKSKLNHKAYTYIPKQEKPVENVNNRNETDKIYLGNFKLTYYCACKKCCGPNAQGITASGKKVQEGVTIAVDPKIIKLGNKVYIDGYGERIAQDTGSAIKGNRIDVYVANHNEALKLGVTNRDVWLIKEA